MLKGSSGRVALIRPPATRPLGPTVNLKIPLSLRYCGSLLQQAGYDVFEIDGLLEPFDAAALTARLQRDRVDAALFSIENFQHARPATLFALADAARQACGAKTLVFGPYPTFFPEVFLEAHRFDAVLLGEPEATVVAAVQALARGEEPAADGIATALRPLTQWAAVDDVNRLPWPLRFTTDVTRYWSLYPLPRATRARWGSLLAGRGCERRCLFCSPFDRATFGSRVRPRAIHDVRDEAAALARSGANVLSFEDDNLTFDPARTIALAEALAPLRVSYVCHARVDELSNEVLRALARSGCAMLKLGVESGSAAVIERLQKSGGDTWRGRVIETVTGARRLGIATCGLFIFGNEGETESDLTLTLSLALEAPFDLIQLHYLTPYPGSRLYDQAPSSLDAARLALLSHYDPCTLRLAPLSPLKAREVVAFSRRLFRRFVWRPHYLWRHLRRFGGFHLHNPHITWRLLKGLFAIGRDERI
jgi:radical SAM superfamily enzyme YgiQ (UPF0313 family)